MEKRKIRLSFLEREFFTGSIDGASVRGHEPVKVALPRGDVHCRAIYPKRLKEAQWVDTSLFQAEFALRDFKVDLAPLLVKNENGVKWLEMFRKYCELNYGEEVPLKFSVGSPRFPREVHYSLLPEDYFERTKGGRKYLEPKGILAKVPEGMVYKKIVPPVKYANGKWISRGIKYDRKALGVNGSEWCCSLEDPLDKEHFHTEGVLLGKLGDGDLEKQCGNFEGGFPFTHSVSLTYLVGITQIKDLNPLTINVELV